MIVLLGIVVFFSAMGIDWANTRYVMEVARGRAHKAAFWSVMQWTSSLVGFLIAVKLTLWLLPVECAGLYVGTWLSMRNAGKVEVQ